jgi:hypothetical protein
MRLLTTTRLLSLFLLAAAIGSAQMTAKQTIPTISVLTPGSPGFDAEIKAINVDTPLTQFGPDARYFAVIRNDGTQTIIGMRLLFMIGTTLIVGMKYVNSPPSGTLLVAPMPFDPLADLIFMHPNDPKLASALSWPPTVPAFWAGKTITVSVDSATYADGTFVGPDAENLYPRLAEQRPRASVSSGPNRPPAILCHGLRDRGMAPNVHVLHAGVPQHFRAGPCRLDRLLSRSLRPALV